MKSARNVTERSHGYHFMSTSLAFNFTCVHSCANRYIKFFCTVFSHTHEEEEVNKIDAKNVGLRDEMVLIMLCIHKSFIAAAAAAAVPMVTIHRVAEQHNMRC